MPFVVTTKRRLAADEWRGGEWVSFDSSTRAVATLEEARRFITDSLYGENTDRLVLIPESGGTVGPLPDGSLIQVEQVSREELMMLLRQARWVSPAQMTDGELLDAFDGAVGTRAQDDQARGEADR